MSELLYAYAVIRDPAAGVPPGLHGVAGAPVHLVRHAGLAAVVGPVPAGEYEEGALRGRLEDLAWLEETARAHQRVVAALAGAGSVLPLRLATVHRDEDGTRRMLAAGRERFAVALERLDGRAEWGVKIYARPPRAAAPASAPASGREYLRRRQQEQRSRDGARRLAAEACRRVHGQLAARAQDTRLHRPQDGRLTGRPEPNLLNAAYLVPRSDGASFAALVGELAAAELEVTTELTGPWAPYSFVAEPAGEDPG